MGDFAKDYAFGVDVKPVPNFDLPATFEGIRRPDGRVATRNYIGILTSVNCSAHVAGMVADIFKKNPFTGDNPLADFPNVDGVVALTHKTGCGMTQDEPLGAAPPHAWRLRAAREFLGRDRARPRLRGEPDRRPDAGAETRRPSARDGHPGSRRHPQDGGSRRRLRARGADRREQSQARASAGERIDRGAAVRRLRRLFRRLGQSGARRRERPAGTARRHGHLVRNAGDLRRRASADAPRGQPRGRRKAGRPDALVGGIYPARRRRDERQSEPRQQGRRPHHDPGKITGRDGEGRQHQSGRCAAITPSR